GGDDLYTRQQLLHAGFFGCAGGYHWRRGWFCSWPAGGDARSWRLLSGSHERDFALCQCRRRTDDHQARRDPGAAHPRGGGKLLAAPEVNIVLTFWWNQCL